MNKFYTPLNALIIMLSLKNSFPQIPGEHGNNAYKGLSSLSAYHITIGGARPVEAKQFIGPDIRQYSYGSH